MEVSLTDKTLEQLQQVNLFENYMVIMKDPIWDKEGYMTDVRNKIYHIVHIRRNGLNIYYKQIIENEPNSGIIKNEDLDIFCFHYTKNKRTKVIVQYHH